MQPTQFAWAWKTLTQMKKIVWSQQHETSMQEFYCYIRKNCVACRPKGRMKFCKFKLLRNSFP